jgi:hypothetical protein
VAGIGRQDGCRAVCLLDKQPTARPHGVHQPPKGLDGVGKVHQDNSAVDEVVVGRLQVVFEDVVAADFEVGQPVIDEEARVEVGGHDAPSWPDAMRQPVSYRTVAGPHVEATPARPDLDFVQMADRDRVGDLRQQRQPLALEGVGAVFRQVTIFLHDCSSKRSLFLSRVRAKHPIPTS